MAKFRAPEPFSGGIFLTYKCTSMCRHCMYACSPKWSADWIDVKGAEKVLTILSERLRGKYPSRSNRIGVNYGVHFTGGEPFLNFELLLKLTEVAHSLELPSLFVETNCFWCVNDKVVEEKLKRLKSAGLQGILISANPFLVEYVPFERIVRCERIGRKVFGGNVIVYHDLFYSQLKRLGLKGRISFEDYLEFMVKKCRGEIPLALSFNSVLPMGRAPYKLGYLYRRYPAKVFFSEACRRELTREWHVHIDNYFNYITGYCGGISLGDARELDSLCEGIELDERPVLKALLESLGSLYEFAVKEFGYRELPEGYVSKCHLCVDIRRHIAKQTDRFEELNPREFYKHLE